VIQVDYLSQEVADHRYALRYRNFIFEAMTVLKASEMLNLKKTPTIWLGFIEKVNAKFKWGIFYPETNLILIDPRRRSYDRILYTLIHECTHSDQYNRGWFKGGKWMGKVSMTEAVMNLTDVKEYRELPWEADVRDRMGPIYYYMAKEMGV